MLSAKADYYFIQKRTTYSYSFLKEGIQGKLKLLQCLSICPNSAVNPFTCIKKSLTVKVISVGMEECSTFYYFCYWIKDFAMHSKALEGFLMKASYKSIFEMFLLYDKQFFYNGKTTGCELEFIKLYYVE